MKPYSLDRQRKQKHRSHHHEEIASGCCGRRGLFAAGRGRVSRQRALSDGGAVLSGAFDQRGPVAARAVGEGHILNRSPGHVDSDDAGATVGAPSHSGATVARRLDTPGDVNGRVVPAPAPSLVHPWRVVRIIGLVSHRRATSPDLVAAVGGVSRRKSGGSTRRASSAGPVVRAQSTNGVTRHVRGERLGEVPVPCVGFHCRWRHGAPLDGLFERRIILGR